MTMVSSGTIFWPLQIAGSSYGNVGLANNSLTFDSSTDRIAYVGRSPITDSIASVYFRTGTVTTGNTMEVRIETVANGRPTGTLWNTNTNGTVVVADSDDNVWKTVTLTAAASLTPGQEFAIVMQNSSGTPNMGLTAPSTGQPGWNSVGQYPLILQDTGGGTYAAPSSSVALSWIVGMTTAGPVYLPGLLPTHAAGTATAFNSGSAPDEYATKFTAPFKCRCIGARVYLENIAAGADFTVSLWPASSSVDGDALAQIAEDGDFPYASTTDGFLDVFWTSPVTLSQNTIYYLGVRADTANNLAIAAAVAAAGITNAINAFGIPSGGTIFQATRTWTAGTAAAWVETATTTLPMLNLILDQVDDGTGTGGSGGVMYNPPLTGT